MQKHFLNSFTKKHFNTMRHFFSLMLTLFAWQVASGATFVGERSDFRDETIYFAITTRFYDGDQSNNTYCWDGELNVAEQDPEWRGDFKGLIDKLDYIKALGFTAVWITPVVENASGLDYHGYHAFNFSKVDPRYESEDVSFQTLIDAAHERDMKIVLDIVLNHTGNFGEENLCPMFTKDYDADLSDIDASMKLHENSVLPSDYFDLASSAQYSTRLAYMKNTDGVNHDTKNYYHHVGNGWNWDEYTRWYGQIAGDCVDLNTENPAVSAYLVECYGKFNKMGVDGFRIDTSGHISRLTFNNAFLPQFTALAEEYKDKRGGGDFFMFGEVCARDRNVTYRNNKNLSPYYYTWKETNTYDWTYDETSWEGITVMEGYYGDHTNINSTIAQGQNEGGESDLPSSSNALLSGNTYHTPDHTQFSGLSVIDFPMHWNFENATSAFGGKSGDSYYNDATYNVGYVDSHDYAPDGAPESQRFAQSQSTWAENLDLMFTFRGIPCLYYGSEIEFKKGCVIDNGTNLALKNSGRAYFGGYIEGDVTINDFADYSNATGNMAVTLKHPLALHGQRLNQIRAAVPALRKGQYSTDGCSGTLAFKRRYTDDTIDSYALVTISGSATFTDILSGTYVDVITGQTYTSSGSLTVSCSGTGNMRVLVMQEGITGKIGDDGTYLYTSSSVTVDQGSYPDEVEPADTQTVKTSSDNAAVTEPEEVIEPSMSEGEQAVFFDNSASAWSGTIRTWIWNDSQNYTGGTWPGQACTYLGNGIWKWTYTGSDVVSGYVIFNNGSSQTANLTYVNGGYYTSSGYVKTIEGAGTITDTSGDTSGDTSSDTSSTTSGYTYTIYYDNSSTSWSTLNAYIWDAGDGNKNYSGSWPGSAMTYDSATGYYVYTFTTTTELIKPMVIFNNGGNGSNQTADLTLVNNAVYTYSGATGETIETEDDEEVVEPDDTSGATVISHSSSTKTVVGIYNVAGVRQNALVRGLNIIHYSDGTTEKKIVR